MRARTYDPSTAQFVSVDPAVETTRAPYNYAGDNPVNASDPSGQLCVLNFIHVGPSCSEVGHALEPLNPVHYYEEEIESYENGCGYFASVAHGLEGAVVGALDVSGVGEEGAAAEEGSTAVENALAGLTPGNSPGSSRSIVPRSDSRFMTSSARVANRPAARIRVRKSSYLMGPAGHTRNVEDRRPEG